MKRALAILALTLLACADAPPARAQAAAAPSGEPDYSQWNRILSTYYDPAKGLDYKALKAKDAAALQNLKAQLGRVHPATLNPKQRLAYWINVYNVNTVATIVEKYPVKSIRDISTDPIIRLNVFKKERVPVFGGKLISLDEVENKNIREAFRDPRIHFAINCAAKSCPPIRTEAYVGAKLDAQLDDQAKRFLTGPLGARFKQSEGELTIATTKIMDWFGDDFDNWAGGKTAFIRKYVPADKQALIDRAGRKIDVEYDDYDWALNDWKR